MFQTEIEALNELILTIEDRDKVQELQKKVNNLKNIRSTMSGLIKNIVSEIDESREQMFKILESIAAIEISKDPKEFNKKRNKLMKKQNHNS